MLILPSSEFTSFDRSEARDINESICSERLITFPKRNRDLHNSENQSFGLTDIIFHYSRHRVEFHLCF